MKMIKKIESNIGSKKNVERQKDISASQNLCWLSLHHDISAFSIAAGCLINLFIISIFVYNKTTEKLHAKLQIQRRKRKKAVS